LQEFVWETIKIHSSDRYQQYFSSSTNEDTL
jgi:hypothetical protein